MKRIVLLALPLAAALMLFQNCGQASDDQQQYGGNGSGYDGKVICEEGSTEDSSVEPRNGLENCVEVSLDQQVKF